MEPKTLVRIEKNGIGYFWNSSYQQNWLTEAVYTRHNNFPLPSAEGISINLKCKDWFFGYVDTETLNKWVMPEELEYLVSQGFQVMLYEVTEYQVGNFQIAFTKESITYGIDITHLYNLTPVRYESA